ncbi:hypothetical protein PG984_003947 [Apiospora sp. TS-2023a]
MGVKGFWDTVSKDYPGRTVRLWELNAEHVEKTGRPMRIAVDAPIDVYKYKTATDHVTASKYGGMNNPTRTLFYHVLHLLAAGVQPVYVYDGPGKPSIKRHKHTGAPPYRPYKPSSSCKLRSETEKKQEGDFRHITYLSKIFLGYLGVPTLEAPGEAEAECAALEKAGLVDAVMSTDGDAFLFGAQTVLRGLNAENKNCMVQVFKMEDLKMAKPPLTPRVIFAMAILAGGDYSSGLPGCGPDLALKIGVSNHGGFLWTLAGREALWEEKFPVWRNGLAKDLEEGKFGKKELALADGLDDNFPDQAVIGYYMGEIKKNTTTRAIDWEKDIDVPRLREFTRVYFDWKYRHFAVKFVRTTVLCLLVRMLLRCLASGTDGSKWVTVKKIKTKGEITAKEVQVKPDHASVVPVNVPAEPIVDTYKGNLKKKEIDEDLEWLPYWLVEKSCRALFQPTDTPTSITKRKSTAGDTSEGALPKRSRGRPPKDRAAADPATIAPKRGQGRPPKPKPSAAKISPCAATPKHPANRTPLQPITLNRGVTATKSQNTAPATVIITPDMTRAKRALAAYFSLDSSVRNPCIPGQIIDLTGDD